MTQIYFSGTYQDHSFCENNRKNLTLVPQAFRVVALHSETRAEAGTKITQNYWLKLFT